MSLTPAQRHQAIGLYKRVLRTAQQTFNNDAATAAAWRAKVRSQWEAAAKEADSTKMQENINMWEDVIKILRQNIVQGVYNPEREAYQLRFTPETELGSNESIKAGREKQLEQLRKSKGSLKCGTRAGSSTSLPQGNTSASSSARSFSTSAWQSAKAKADAGIAEAAAAWTTAGPVPRPPPHFDQVALLSDGSSIRLTTTSPRSLSRLTRDPTNHPVWNPSMERTQGSGEEDESGRVARFRKRFGGSDATAPSTAAGQSNDRGEGTAPPSQQRFDFGTEDLDWMSVGGREAKGGSSQAPKSKGKGKK